MAGPGGRGLSLRGTARRRCANSLDGRPRSSSPDRDDITFTMHIRVVPFWDSSGAALLCGRRRPTADSVAHACGDNFPPLVTICDNFEFIEHSYDPPETKKTSSRLVFLSG